MNEIAKIAMLLCTGLVLNASLADWYREKVMWHGIIERTGRQFEEVRDDIDTLILGDSHPKRGVFPSVLGNAFNLSIPGENYIETFFVLKAQINDERVELRTVILPMDLHSLSSWNLDGFAHVHHYSRFVDYFEVGFRRRQLPLYAVRAIQGRYAPYVSERRNILSYFETEKPRDMFWLQRTQLVGGALVDKRSILEWKKRARVDRTITRVALHFKNRDLITPIVEEYFLQILDLCSAHDINVVLVQYPVTRDYLVAASELIDIAAFDRDTRALIQPYDNVQLIESRKMFRNRLDVFIDSDHLNKKGATLFSRVVKRRILNTE
jgi:hypothetical protein